MKDAQAAAERELADFDKHGYLTLVFGNKVVSHHGWALLVAIELCESKLPLLRMYGPVIVIRLEVQSRKWDVYWRQTRPMFKEYWKSQ